MTEKVINRIIYSNRSTNRLNLLVDLTLNSPISEFKEMLVEIFEKTMKNGPLTNNKVSGAIINIEDIMVHSDSIHRGGGQMIPTMRNGIFNAMLESQKISLMVPWYCLNIKVLKENPEDTLKDVKGSLVELGGEVIEELLNDDYNLSLGFEVGQYVEIE
jgi:elongation factor 2